MILSLQFISLRSCMTGVPVTPPSFAKQLPYLFYLRQLKNVKSNKYGVCKIMIGVQLHLACNNKSAKAQLELSIFLVKSCLNVLQAFTFGFKQTQYNK